MGLNGKVPSFLGQRFTTITLASVLGKRGKQQLVVEMCKERGYK